MTQERNEYKFVGIDGCPDGWFYVAIDVQGNFCSDVLSQFSEVRKFLPHTKQILVDIPIGLPCKGAEKRKCDLEARKMISPRGPSVFPAPARSALGLGSHKACSDANYRVLGKRLSVQSWAITDKIKEVDDFMRANRPGKGIREMHPEVAFCSLNGGVPMQHKKGRTVGVEERLGVLSNYWEDARECYLDAGSRFRRRQVARDDIVDAIVGAVVARERSALRSLPAKPLLDEEGLSMEIVY